MYYCAIKNKPGHDSKTNQTSFTTSSRTPVYDLVVVLEHALGLPNIMPWQRPGYQPKILK